MTSTTLTITIDALDSAEKAARLQEALTDPRALLSELGEYLLASTKDRFKAQLAPDGTPWQALTPRYLKRKRRNKDKILTLNGTLSSQIAFQIEGADTVAVVSNRAYSAIHQFGGEINRKPAERTIFRKRNKAGKLARRFSKKDAKGAVATPVKIGPYTIKIPARPYLGLSEADAGELQAKTQDFLRDLLA